LYLHTSSLNPPPFQGEGASRRRADILRKWLNGEVEFNVGRNDFKRGDVRRWEA